MPLDEPIRQFLLAQLQSSRVQIREYIKIREDLRRNALLVSGAFWAWLATQPTYPAFRFAIWVPTGLAILYAFRSRLISSNLTHRAKYNSNVEKAFELPEGVSWSLGEQEARAWHKWLQTWSWIYWSAIVGGNTALACLYLWAK